MVNSKVKKEEKAILKKQEAQRATIHKHMLEEQRKNLSLDKKANNDSFISLQHVNKIYDNHVQAVYDFNLEIKEHEFIVLVGPSGCGKSTTLRMIAGLEDITYGDLYIRGVFSNNIPGKNRNIAMVFQSYALYPHLTVYENMAFSLKIQHVPSDEIERRIKIAAETLEIKDYLQRKPAQLSGGQCQRVALGRAIVRDTNLFLMDEPLSNLDAKLRVSMRGEIIKLHNKLNATTVYVTHDQTEAMTMASRIVVMNKGYIQQIGTPQEIFNHPANTFVATFIGSPSMNLLDAELDNSENIIFSQGYKINLTSEQKQICLDFYQNGLLEAKKELEYIEVNNEEKISLNNRLNELQGASFADSKQQKKADAEIQQLKAEISLNDKANTRRNELLNIIEQYEKFIATNKANVIFGVRPDDIVDANEITAKVKASEPFEVNVIISELFGNQYYVHTLFNDKEIIYTAPSDTLISPNDKLKAVLNLNKIHIFDKVTTKIIF